MIKPIASKLFNLINHKYRLLIFFINDYLIGIFSLIFSALIFFNYQQSIQFITNKIVIISIIPLVKFLIYYVNQIYKVSWRYASLKDILKTFKAIAISSFILPLPWILNLNFPIKILIIDLLIFNLLFFSSRFTIRLLRSKSTPQKSKNHTHYLIIGAGDAGEMIARELIKASPNNHIVGFCDDNQLLHGKTIHQSPVLGFINNLDKIITTQSIDQIIIAIPSANSDQFRHILSVCKSTNIPFLTTPSINEIIDNTIKLDKLRDVSIIDLLGRSPIHIDTSSIQSIVKGNTILITGAGGSIGSELSRQIFSYKPKKVILLDHSEFHLYTILMELTNNPIYKKIEIQPICLDIKLKKSLQKVFKEHKPSIVFHSAAYKHVPLMEVNPEQAILNNIGGTKNIIECCNSFNVTQAVIISTDKAVEPSNAMGATKRLCELLTLDYSKTSNTKFCCVRFGNVLGSYGSVIPLFKEQIKNGGPITITDPNMTRYFMTIKEAASLVFQASSISDGGELFVLDMGTPIKIPQLASDLIRLSGLKVDDIKVTYTGLRPGEKLTEKLFYDFEKPNQTTHTKIQCCRPKFTISVAPLIDDLFKLLENSTTNKETVDQLFSIINNINSKINLGTLEKT